MKHTKCHEREEAEPTDWLGNLHTEKRVARLSITLTEERLRTGQEFFLWPFGTAFFPLFQKRTGTTPTVHTLPGLSLLGGKKQNS